LEIFPPGDLKERWSLGRNIKTYYEGIKPNIETNALGISICSDNKETARVLSSETILEEMNKLTDIKIRAR